MPLDGTISRVLNFGNINLENGMKTYIVLEILPKISISKRDAHGLLESIPDGEVEVLRYNKIWVYVANGAVHHAITYWHVVRRVRIVEIEWSLLRRLRLLLLCL